MSKVFSQFGYTKMLDPTANTVIEAGISLTKKYSELKGKTNAEYEVESAKFNESLFGYCVKSAGFEYTGLDCLKNPQITKSVAFREKFEAVLAQTIAPTAPAVVSEQYMELAEIQQVGWGKTARFVIQPNDLFLVSEIAEGVKNGGMQRLYNDEITVNPTPKQIRFEIPWYQVAAGIFDFGAWSYKVGLSFAGYIQKQVVDSFTQVITDGLAASSPYFTTGFTDNNYLTIGQRVETANGDSDVYVMGTKGTLGKVFPTTVGLQYGLGEELAKKGYLDMYKGFRLMEIKQAQIPGTVNTTASLMIPENSLYFIAMAQNRPIKVVFEGESVTVESNPTTTPDKSMGLTITLRVGISAVVGNKFGSITSIV